MDCWRNFTPDAAGLEELTLLRSLEVSGGAAGAHWQGPQARQPLDLRPGHLWELKLDCYGKLLHCAQSRAWTASPS